MPSPSSDRTVRPPLFSFTAGGRGFGVTTGRFPLSHAKRPHVLREEVVDRRASGGSWRQPGKKQLASNYLTGRRIWGVFHVSPVIADKNRRYALSQNCGRSENFIIFRRNAVPDDAKERLAGRFFQCSHYYSIAENEVCRRSSFSGRIYEGDLPPICFGGYAFSNRGRFARYAGEFRGFFMENRSRIPRRKFSGGECIIGIYLANPVGTRGFVWQ